MKTLVYSHGFSMTESIKDYLSENILQALKGFRLPEHCQVTAVMEPVSSSHRKGNLFVCKIRISGLSVSVQKEHSNLYAAIENACDLLRRLLGKKKQKVRNR